MVTEFLHKIRYLILICVIFLIGYTIYQVSTYRVYYNSSVKTVLEHPSERFFLWCSTDDTAHKTVFKYTKLIGNDRSYVTLKKGTMKFSCSPRSGDCKVTVADSRTKKVYLHRELGFNAVKKSFPKNRKLMIIFTGNGYSGSVTVNYH
ncbi:MAG: hypothetical protein ACOYJJ_03770 [Anaerovoracaceae bacterium]|jgi:hypothetical protein